MNTDDDYDALYFVKEREIGGGGRKSRVDVRCEVVCWVVEENFKINFKFVSNHSHLQLPRREKEAPQRRSL